MAAITRTFILNGESKTVSVEDNLRMLWVLRDVLKVTGPKYGCGINVCKACTSHINGKAFNPCSVPFKQILDGDEITTIEGLAKQAKDEGNAGPNGLHPVQEAWLKHQVAQCGFCQPGQIMAAVMMVKKAKKDNRQVTDAELDELRNVCRCGTYPRIRDAIKDASK